MKLDTFSVAALGVLCLVSCAKTDDAGAALEISITSTKEVYSESNQFKVEVKYASDWTVSSTADWAVPSVSSGSGDGSFTVKVGEWDGNAERKCRIKVSAEGADVQSFNINQLPYPSNYISYPKKYINPAGEEFPILAWFSIYGDYLTKAKYTEMAEAGFNLSYSQLYSINDINKSLTASYGTGVKIIASCYEYGKKDASKVLEVVNACKNNSQLAGYSLRDEPNISDMDALGSIVQKVRSADEKHFVYINLFPNYAGTSVLGGTYTEYLEAYLAKCHLSYVSFDHYPVLMDGLRGDYYSNLEVVRDVTVKAGVPFWAFALATGHANVYPQATYEALAFQVYSNLAYGAQGLEYFTYIRPGEGDASEASYWNCPGPLDYGGGKTVVYDYVKRMNKEVKALTPVFLGASVIEVAHTRDLAGNLPNWRTHELSTMPTNVTSLVSDGAGVVVSHLENQGSEYMLVVNRNIYASQKITVNFSADVIRISSDASESKVSAGEQTFTLTKGNMALFKLK